MDYAQLLDQTMAVLKPVADTGPAVGTNLIANALWDWLKAKFPARSAAAAEAVADVVKSPGQPANWEVLRAQLAKALAEDAAFGEELAAQLARHAPAQSVSQRAKVTGDGNIVIQSTGGNVGVKH